MQSKLLQYKSKPISYKTEQIAPTHSLYWKYQIHERLWQQTMEMRKPEEIFDMFSIEKESPGFPHTPPVSSAFNLSRVQDVINTRSSKQYRNTAICCHSTSTKPYQKKVTPTCTACEIFTRCSSINRYQNCVTLTKISNRIPDDLSYS